MPNKSKSSSTAPTPGNHLEPIIFEVPRAIGRLDALICAAVDDLSRTRAAWHILHGHVTLSDRRGKLKPGFKPKPGTIVTVKVVPIAPMTLKAQDLPLEFIYKDKDLLVVNKAAGMVVHPAVGHPDGTLLNALLHHVPELADVGDPTRPGLVHRIDKDTSGLLVVTRSPQAMRKLAANFADHTVRRRYAAVCLGRLRQDTLTISTLHGRHQRDRKRFSGKVTQGREAVTHIQVLARSALCSLVVCTLETGRTHQIRMHLAERGHPIAGDALYGGVRKHPRTHRTIEEITALSRLHRQALHAYALGFKHPTNGQEMSFEVPWPDDLKALVDTLFEPEETILPSLKEAVFGDKN